MKLNQVGIQSQGQSTGTIVDRCPDSKHQLENLFSIGFSSVTRRSYKFWTRALLMTAEPWHVFSGRKWTPCCGHSWRKYSWHASWGGHVEFLWSLLIVYDCSIMINYAFSSSVLFTIWWTACSVWERYGNLGADHEETLWDSNLRAKHQPWLWATTATTATSHGMPDDFGMFWMVSSSFHLGFIP